VPHFALEKTSSITDEIADRITEELRMIAEAHLSRRRGCLEAVVRYLLGERGLQDSTLFPEDDQVDNLGPPEAPLNDDSSSDEDDTVTADPASTMSADLELSANGIVSVNRDANVPLPRACG